MERGAIFSPIHQGQQELIAATQFRWPAKIAQSLFDYRFHLLEGAAFNSSRSFEFFIT